MKLFSKILALGTLLPLNGCLVTTVVGVAAETVEAGVEITGAAAGAAAGVATSVITSKNDIDGDHNGRGDR